MNQLIRNRLFIIVPILMWFNLSCYSVGVYQKPEKFLAEAFSNNVPAAKSIWLTKELKPSVKLLLGHELNKLRLRYWQASHKTVWILEEIGKEELITVGFVIKNHKIEKVKVLIFRESRGWEIRHDFFTKQFKGLTLTSANKLSKHIDGITGATLSVNAVSRLSKVALYLHKKVVEENE